MSSSQADSENSDNSEEPDDSTQGRLARTRRFPKSLRITAAILVGVLGAAAIWWFVWVPNHRPVVDASAGEVHGIDVSNHQGAIDWKAVEADSIGAALIKATEGNDYVDPRFAQNWADSGKTSILRGAYHFFTLCSPGAEQAENFLQAAPPEEGTLPPAIDLELIGNCKERPPQARVDQELEDFRQLVEEAWDRPLLVYARGSFTSEYSIGALANNPQWVTNFFVRPITDDWAVWQVHYFAAIDGIEGGVDIDVVRTRQLLSGE